MPERAAFGASSLRQHHFDIAASAAQALALAVVRQLQLAIGARGAASLIVSGGRSPIMLFEALRDQPIDWRRVWITLADERWVEPTSVDSNERLLREHLLIGAAANAQFVPLKSAHTQPDAALEDRSEQLQRLPRPFDVVVLGMGDDGHTASLFPGSAGLAAALDPRAVAPLVAITPPTAAHPRISHSLSSLLDARQIYLLLQGATKRARLAEALAGASPLKLPIAAVLMQTKVPVDVYWSDA